MTANDSKSYLSYLNKLVDQYSSNYHHAINKKPISVDYCVLTKKLGPILKLLNLKVMIESELVSIRIFLVKITLKVGLEKYLLLIEKVYTNIRGLNVPEDGIKCETLQSVLLIRYLYMKANTTCKYI